MQAIELSTTNERAREPGTFAAPTSARPLRSSELVWTGLDPIYPSRWPTEALVSASRLYLPVSVLTASLFAMFVCLGHGLPLLSDRDAAWLTWSHVQLAFAFLLTQLTNRRYGPGYAFVQILLSLAVCGVIAAFGPVGIVGMIPEAAIPSAREAEAFVGAFVAAGYLSAVAFDVARGPRWWTAPLTASYVSSLGFALLYYPLAYAGSDVSWVPHMSTHAGILIAASVVGLLPYWLLRPVIRPLAGFGGY